MQPRYFANFTGQVFHELILLNEVLLQNSSFWGLFRFKKGLYPKAGICFYQLQLSVESTFLMTLWRGVEGSFLKTLHLRPFWAKKHQCSRYYKHNGLNFECIPVYYSSSVQRSTELYVVTGQRIICDCKPKQFIVLRVFLAVGRSKSHLSNIICNKNDRIQCHQKVGLHNPHLHT